MKIGIILAMREELNSLLKKIALVKEYKIFDLTFYECEFNNINCVLVESGIGKVNAARTTQILIDNLKVDYILNIGVAGGISPKVNIGDIVIAKSLVQHDFDLTGFNHEKGHIPNVGKFINCDERLIEIAKSVSIDTNIHCGIVASGDIFVTELKMSEKIFQKFNALCVEMEGASIAQVCYLSQIPFLIIRSISDSPNGNNIIDYEKFLVSSSEICAKFVLEIIKSL